MQIINTCPLILNSSNRLWTKEISSDSEADKVAQQAGYKDAHDFKDQNKPDGKGSDWNMMLNRETGEIFLVIDKNIKLKDEPTTRTFLSKPELVALEAQDLNGIMHLIKARDSFLFSPIA